MPDIFLGVLALLNCIMGALALGATGAKRPGARVFAWSLFVLAAVNVGALLSFMQ